MIRAQLLLMVMDAVVVLRHLRGMGHLGIVLPIRGGLRHRLDAGVMIPRKGMEGMTMIAGGDHELVCDGLHVIAQSYQ
jgi:hypothetical protein